jgi:hypothetical protein
MFLKKKKKNLYEGYGKKIKNSITCQYWYQHWYHGPYQVGIYCR